MKRLISICIVCLLTIGMLSSVTVSVSAGVDVTASAATVTAGQKVTITVKYSGDGKTIAGIDGTIDYNTDLFTYVSFSGDGVDVNGGAGKVRFVFEATGVTAPKSVNISFTFEAKKPGACTFTITFEISNAEKKHQEGQNSTDKTAVEGRARRLIYLKNAKRLYIVKRLKKHRRAIAKRYRGNAAHHGKALYLARYLMPVRKPTEHQKADDYASAQENII